jgi:hypothetical protein
MRAFAVLAMLVACFDKPSRPAGVSDGAAPLDGSLGDPPGPMVCAGGAMAVLFEGFDEGDADGVFACNATGGSVDGPTGTLVRHAGLLTFAGTAGVSRSASCIWTSLPAHGGVILKWTTLDSITTSDTAAMTAIWTQSTSRTTGLSFARGSSGFDISLTSGGIVKGMTLADPSDTWWCILPASSAMAGKFSNDASTWVPAGTDPGVSPIAVAALQIDFAAVDGNQVELDAIYLCP